MTLLEQIQEHLKQLPPDKQSEVLDFARFLQQQIADRQTARPRSLRQHPAFGSWRERGIDALRYQQEMRAEWDDHG